MLDKLLTLLIGLIGGFAVGLQSPIAGAMGGQVGGIASSFIIHLSGAILSGALLAAVGGEQIHNWRTLPWYMLTCGGLGVILYMTIRYTMPRLGGASMVMLIIIGQLLMGVLVDQFGWFGVAIRPLTGQRLLAIGLLMAGGFLLGR